MIFNILAVVSEFHKILADITPRFYRTIVSSIVHKAEHYCQCSGPQNYIRNTDVTLA